MRRSHTTRHHGARPSGVHNLDDMGILREPEETMEVALRRQLLERERENDKLRTQIETLQAQLAERPPIETIQAVSRERQNLELLLQGTQRENEKSMEALERSRGREKQLERKLTELLGENWQATLEMPPPPTVTTRGFHTRSLSSISSPMSPSPRSGTPLSLNQPQLDAQTPKPASLEQIEQVKLLILGMEQRLQNREEKLMKIVEQAEGEGKRFEEGRKAVLAAKT